ncbi:hypothetical protein BDN71DRAFT_1474525 [Pleurotus eryngii]|uniref:Uncharacterized protein n=1 Tax=Pleurotus eryngii TaxID=5323 RepID=A0A9P5ZP87_PLEER|nr:hypothetical protein BDN71DRAFT_1474525 [Pleurotus eryngii]
MPSFPAPIGGVTLRTHDLVPSIVFLVAYCCLIPVMLYRIIDKKSRTTIFIGTNAFVIERVVLFCIRTIVSAKDGRESDAVTEYMQVTIGMGFVAIAQDVANLLRSMLVNSTYEYPRPDARAPELITPSEDAGWSCGLPLSAVPSLAQETKLPDMPRHRFWWRRFIDATTVLFIISIITGFIGNSLLVIQRHDRNKTHINQVLRYISTVLVLWVTVALVIVSVWAKFKMPRVDRRSDGFMIYLSILLCITGIYRSYAMSNITTELTSQAPGSLNTPADKTTFYIFHILPEWMAAATLFGFRMREIFQTGLSGDNRWRDERPDEREDRLEEEREKEEKKKAMIQVSVASRFDDAVKYS